MGREENETQMERYAREEREDKEWEISRAKRMLKAAKELEYCSCGGEVVIALDDNDLFYGMCLDCNKCSTTAKTPEEAAQNWRE